MCKAIVSNAANQWARLFYGIIGFSYDFYINVIKYFHLSGIWFAGLSRKQTSLSDYFIHLQFLNQFPRKYITIYCISTLYCKIKYTMVDFLDFLDTKTFAVGAKSSEAYEREKVKCDNNIYKELIWNGI